MVRELPKEILNSLVEKLVKLPASKFKSENLEHTYYDKENDQLISIECHPYADSNGSWGNNPFYFVKCYNGNSKKSKQVFENQSDKKGSILERLYDMIEEKVSTYEGECERRSEIKNERQVMRKLAKLTK